MKKKTRGKKVEGNKGKGNKEEGKSYEFLGCLVWEHVTGEVRGKKTYICYMT